MYLINDQGDGWMKAEHNHQQGYIPANYVQIILKTNQSSTKSVKSTSIQSATTVVQHVRQNNVNADGALMKIHRGRERHQTGASTVRDRESLPSTSSRTTATKPIQLRYNLQKGVVASRESLQVQEVAVRVYKDGGIHPNTTKKQMPVRDQRAPYAKDNSSRRPPTTVEKPRQMTTLNKEPNEIRVRRGTESKALQRMRWNSARRGLNKKKFSNFAGVGNNCDDERFLPFQSDPIAPSAADQSRTIPSHRHHQYCDSQSWCSDTNDERPCGNTAPASPIPQSSTQSRKVTGSRTYDQLTPLHKVRLSTSDDLCCFGIGIVL